MTLHGKHLIGGEPSREGSDGAFRGVDPTGESLYPAYCAATAGEIDRAFALADEAWPALLLLPRQRRAELLERIADELEACPHLLGRAGQETALPAGRLTGERGRTTGQLRLLADVVRDGGYLDVRVDPALPGRQPTPRPDIRRMLRPLGPVVVFGASNFPLAFSVAGGDTAAALAAGCPVVCKAHPAHPGASELAGAAIARAVAACDLPPGTFSLVHGADHATGLALVRHPSAAAVAFTGSLTGGRALFDAACARPSPIPVYAEMGSTNPSFVFPGALEDPAALAAGFHGSVTLGVGQFCTNPGLIFALDDDRTSAFADALRQLTEQAADGTMLHAGIRRSYADGLRRLGALDGVTHHGRPPADDDGCAAPPALFLTDAAAFAGEPALSDELFGPATVLVRCPDRAAMLAAARGLAGQLAACIHGDDAELAAAGDLLAILERTAGRVVFNAFPTGVEVCAAMNHGGPYPAAIGQETSVGTAAIRRFCRPVCFQDCPPALLPPELRD